MLKKLKLYINIFFAILLIISGYAKYMNPTIFWMPAFVGIAYPFLLLVVIFQFLSSILIFKSKKQMLVSILAIIFTWSALKTTFNISAPERSVSEMSILSWNVKNFDLYNWSKNTETHELMMKLLEEKNPDVLCLQEFYTEKKGKFRNILEIKKRLGYKYYYFGETFNIKKNKKWGLVTFSKYPIKDHGQIKFDKESRLNSCIYTDIQYTKDSIFRVYNVHLQSLHFGNDDYDYLNELKEKQKADVESSLKILNKIKNGFKKRAIQAKLISEHNNAFKGKSILCGDFNDTSTSFAYHLLSKNMQDAFQKKGVGFGKTLTNPTPFFRIDFMLFSNKFHINNYKTYYKKYSDHFPVQVYFEY